MCEEDALAYLTAYLRAPPRSDYSDYGYDVYIPNVIRAFLASEKRGHDNEESRIEELSPSFYAAAWELCRRGIVRPGIKRYRQQETSEGNAGNGYSITPFGRRWLDERDRDDFVPTEPGRFAEMIAPFRSRFGTGFQQRAQEAIACYGAHAYLACCSMCGAAAESVLLSVACAKKAEPEVLRMYKSTGGRGRVESLVIGQAPDRIKQEFLGFTSLLKYWRDESAHGQISRISDNEAYTSLGLLLRFAHWCDDYWGQLTGPGS